MKEGKKKVLTKGFVISLLVCFAVGCLIAGLIFLALYYGQKHPEPIPLETLLGYLADGFGLTGLLLAMFYVLSWISAKGTFDILYYSVYTLFYSVFAYKKWKEDPERDYYSYKKKKDASERKPLLAILLISVIFIFAGLGFLIGYHATLPPIS